MTLRATEPTYSSLPGEESLAAFAPAALAPLALLPPFLHLAPAALVLHHQLRPRLFEFGDATLLGGRQFRLQLVDLLLRVLLPLLLVRGLIPAGGGNGALPFREKLQNNAFFLGPRGMAKGKY